MELKDRKKIKNGKLPGFANGLGFGDYFTIALMAGEGVASGINSMRNEDMMLADAGTSEGSINGISYESTNNVGDMKNYDREMGTSFLTNPIKGLTMLFGRRAQKRKLQRALAMANAKNTFNAAGAADTYLELEYAKQYGDTQNQVLFAKNGKDAVQTSNGEVSMSPNSRIEGGEVIYNKQNKTAHIVPGPADGDKNLSNILPSDVIITNKFGLASKAHRAAKVLELTNKDVKNRGKIGIATNSLMALNATKVLDDISAEQQYLRDTGMLPQPKMKKYLPGKDNEKWMWDWNNIPRVESLPAWIPLTKSSKASPYDPKKGPLAQEVYDGKPYDGSKYASTVPKKTTNNKKLPSNWWIDGLGVLTSAGSLISDALQKPKRSNSYRSNPYSKYALTQLLELRYNPYNDIQLVYDQNNRGLYNINRAGGLSGAQKELANIALNLATQSQIAKVYANSQLQNNKYLADSANAMISAGQADRAARMAANQWDLDYYSKSHAAKQQMVQLDLYNTLAALQQGYKNSLKRYMFDRTIDNYIA